MVLGILDVERECAGARDGEVDGVRPVLVVDHLWIASKSQYPHKAVSFAWIPDDCRCKMIEGRIQSDPPSSSV